MDEKNSLTSQIATTFQFIVPFRGLLVPEVVHMRLRWTACSRGREGNAPALSTSPIDPQFVSDLANQNFSDHIVSQNFSDHTVSQYLTLTSSSSMHARTTDHGPSSGPRSS